MALGKATGSSVGALQGEHNLNLKTRHPSYPATVALYFLKKYSNPSCPATQGKTRSPLKVVAGSIFWPRPTKTTRANCQGLPGVCMTLKNGVMTPLFGVMTRFVVRVMETPGIAKALSRRFAAFLLPGAMSRVTRLNAGLFFPTRSSGGRFQARGRCCARILWTAATRWPSPKSGRRQAPSPSKQVVVLHRCKEKRSAWSTNVSHLFGPKPHSKIGPQNGGSLLLCLL